MAKPKYCHFCGLHESDVDRIFGGPASFICNNCVELMHGMLTQPPRPSSRPLAEFKAEENRLRAEYGPNT